MFTQRISMDCTKEQYEKYLKEELLKMGYEEVGIDWFDREKIIVNNISARIGCLGSTMRSNNSSYDRVYLGSFNAPLFLALAAMTDKAEGNYGEYWICIRESSYFNFTKDKLYKSIGVYHDKSPMFYDNKGVEDGALIKHLFKYFRKATKEEIMAKIGEKIGHPSDFTYKTNDESYVYITEAEMISLLKSKGYKILRKLEIWKEV